MKEAKKYATRCLKAGALLGVSAYLVGVGIDASETADVSDPAQPVITVEVSAAVTNRKQKLVTAEFAALPGDSGSVSADEAALAFFQAHDEAYLETNEATELTGFVLRSDTGRYFFTNAAELPNAFILRARIDGPEGWSVEAFLHTHPGGHKDQDAFSEPDRQAVLKTKRDYFLRAPNGNVLYMNARLARSTRILAGATGRSVCAENTPCFAKHPLHDRRARGDWSTAIRR